MYEILDFQRAVIVVFGVKAIVVSLELMGNMINGIWTESAIVSVEDF